MSKLIKLSTKFDRFNNSMIVGDVRERVKVLVESGQTALALLTAKTHNLEDMIPPLEEAMEKQEGGVTP